MSEEGQALTNEPALKPAPRSLVEKAYDANITLFLTIALLTGPVRAR